MAEDFFGRLADSLREASARDWRTLARPNQLPPEGDWWQIWLLLAGRGFGKTRVLSEWILDQVQAGTRRIAVLGATTADCRDVLVEGDSGILACAPRWNRPEYEPTKRRLTWPNGAIATTYSADEPERLRGPQHDAAVCDELAAWRYPEAWDMLMLGLRLGKNPRCVVATTPKPTKLIRDLVAREGKDVVITRGTTYENRDNLAPQFLRTIVKRFEGSRLGRQELDGELLTDTPGALWSVQVLEETRVTTAPPMQRVVVAIDPSGSGGEDADEAGIIVAGLGLDGQGYVVADLSAQLAPPEWARRAIDAYHVYKADRAIAETNYGADMVIATIAAVDPTVPVKAITSSRGKVLRAEPISTLFEQGRAHLVGTFPQLEDQLTSFTHDYNRARDGSPDRCDAMVFALTELMCGQPVGGYFTESSLLVNGEPVDLPQRIDYVFAVAAIPTKAVGQVGVVFFAVCLTGVAPPLTILDWDVWPADGALFDARLPTVFERLECLTDECRARLGSAGLWAQSSSGVCAALLQQGIEGGHRVTDIDNETVLPQRLSDRVHAASRHIHTGKMVKVTRAAHEKLVTLAGVTRNHLLAQFHAFRTGEEMDSDELLNALCSGVILALEEASSVQIESPR
ncbi:MAG: DNA-packaging protein [Steroidobacteraceae bacterium]